MSSNKKRTKIKNLNLTEKKLEEVLHDWRNYNDMESFAAYVQNLSNKKGKNMGHLQTSKLLPQPQQATTTITVVNAGGGAGVVFTSVTIVDLKKIKSGDYVRFRDGTGSEVAVIDSYEMKLNFDGPPSYDTSLVYTYATNDGKYLGHNQPHDMDIVETWRQPF